MKLEVHPDAESASRKAAAHIARCARRAGRRFVLALSGGETPRRMVALLAEEAVPWGRVHVVQVDERIAPAGSGERNVTGFAPLLPPGGNLPPAQLHAMPVENPDAESAARRYATALERLAGVPPVLDLVHLGLGADGHTASLVPGDPVVDCVERDVAVTRSYQGYRRLTLTLPVINRTRQIVWLVTGAAKAPMLARLVYGDSTIPAGRVARERATVFADRAAAVALREGRLGAG
ncbi:MAG TPA: 6-phosphogluconolactonase [Pelomicrobium sp.]|nr:6-phosphogluconolactonase [Pelomicrobium sp.]